MPSFAARVRGVAKHRAESSKFPKLPAEVIPTIVAFWAHVGDY